MTTTAIISGQSMGTGSNVGDNLFAAKLTAQTTTTAFLLCVRVTEGAGPTNPGTVRVFFTSTSFSISAANGPSQLGATSRYVDVILSDPRGGQVIIRDGSLEPLTGANIHVWASAPQLGTAATLDVNVVELP